jgi:hypothetical protein
MPKGCLTCKHASFVAPVGWKPGYSGQEYEARDASLAIRQTRIHQDVLCTLNPVWVPFKTNHYCGQWAASEFVNGNISYFIWGSHSDAEWDRMRQLADEAQKEAKTLHRQLKGARQLSASRLARLNKAKLNSADHDP